MSGNQEPSFEGPCDPAGEHLRVAGIIAESVVDGPGFRSVIFGQGCPFECEGCHNVQARPTSGGTVVSVAAVAERLRAVKLVTGVTFSGGEPFLQAPAFARLSGEVRAMGRDIVVFTGYTWEQLATMAGVDGAVATILRATWLLVDGPFVLAQRDLSLAFRGSRNQRVIDVQASLKVGEVIQWTPRK